MSGNDAVTPPAGPPTELNAGPPTDPPTGPNAEHRASVGRVIAFLAGPVPISVVAALLIGALAIGVAGINPLSAYGAMVQGSLTGRGLSNTLQRATPIIGMAMALAIAFRAGVFNLGGEGQMVFGGLAGTLVALYLPGPGPLAMVAACLAAMAAGALWAAVSAILETGIGVPILISSLLLNYPARYFSSYLVRFPLKEQGSSMVATPAVPDGTRIPSLIPPGSGLGESLRASLGRQNVIVLVTQGVNYSLLVILAIVALTIFVNRRTPGGFEAGLAGLNLRFAQYGGVHTKALVLRTMMVSGGISGLVGVMLVLGSDYRLIDGALVATNYAWTGLLVALLAANRPIGVLVAGIFFAALIAGGEAMQRSDGVSAQISQVIQAAVIVLIVVRVTLPRLRRRGAQSPGAAFAAPAADDEVGRV